MQGFRGGVHRPDGFVGFRVEALGCWKDMAVSSIFFDRGYASFVGLLAFGVCLACRFLLIAVNDAFRFR